TIESFRIGYAPASRSALKEHLREHGFTPTDMALSGMVIAGDDIPEPYDRFRNRVMFPITDLKGRVIAFGGRALDPDAPAKYLNSPETPLFHKGAVLVNAARARSLAHDRDRLIAVEGYMDVVALSEAGFGEAVAPLGTALTADQIKLMWRMVPEPILCFDGDVAGKKAAHRAIDVVLADLRPGQSVAFAFLPDGLDPDDLIRQHGADAVTDVLTRTRPLIDMLWERETQSGPLTTPEQRAALETRLRTLTATIQDATVRSHYEREVRDRLYRLSRAGQPPFNAFRGKGGAADGTRNATGGASYARPVLTPDWRQRDRARLDGPARGPRGPFRGPGRGPGGRRPGDLANQPLASAELSSLNQPVPPREALILKTILNHPHLIDEDSEALAALVFKSDALSALRDEILNIHACSNLLDTRSLRSQLTKMGVAKVVDLVARTMTHISDRFAEPDASATEVAAAWHHILALQQREGSLVLALRDAEEAWRRDCTPDAGERLLELKREIARLEALDIDASNTDLEPTTKTDTVNGAGQQRDNDALASARLRH
ncbi:MAG: DNA primase, partial [Azonexus sp.]